MSISKLPRFFFYLSILLTAFLLNVSAQHTATPVLPSAMTTISADEWVSQYDQGDPVETPVRSFRERDLGWVTGRVVDSSSAADGSENSTARGVAGVKIILRSTDLGYSAFIREQVSNDDGAYDFPSLGAGKYTIAIDPATLPTKYRVPAVDSKTVEVRSLDRTYVELPVEPKRSIMGTVFIDKDGDGQYKPGKDEPVEGFYIAVDGNLAVSNVNGAYSLQDLPPGRVAMLITRPKSSQSSHIVLDLGTGPVTNRVVNIAVNR